MNERLISSTEDDIIPWVSGVQAATSAVSLSAQQDSASHCLGGWAGIPVLAQLLTVARENTQKMGNSGKKKVYYTYQEISDFTNIVWFYKSWMKIETDIQKIKILQKGFFKTEISTNWKISLCKWIVRAAFFRVTATRQSCIEAIRL